MLAVVLEPLGDLAHDEQHVVDAGKLAHALQVFLDGWHERWPLGLRAHATCKREWQQQWAGRADTGVGATAPTHGEVVDHDFNDGLSQRGDEGFQ